MFMNIVFRAYNWILIIQSCFVFYPKVKTPSKHLPWWRRLEELFVFGFRRSLQDVYQDEYIPLTLTLSEDDFKTSWSRPIYLSWSSRRLQDVLPRRSQDVHGKPLQNVFKTFSKRFQDIFKTSCKNVLTTSSRRLRDVLKTSSRRLEDIFKMSWKDVFKTFLRLFKLNCSWWRNFKTSSKRIQTVSETYC